MAQSFSSSKKRPEFGEKRGLHESPPDRYDPQISSPANS